MDNEIIKEILDFKENADYKKLSCDEIAILKDYITNLQQENDNLKNIISSVKEDFLNANNELTNLQQKIKHYEETTTFGDYVKEVNLLVDYKSRIEKAVKYIEKNLLPSHSIEKTDWEFEDVIFSDLPVEVIKPLIDILNRSDE